MRLYTILENNEEVLAVAFGETTEAYYVNSAGVQFRDMNDLICNITPQQLEQLRKLQQSAPQERKVMLDQVKICAPVPKPMQDVICLGINYAEHAKEADKFSSEAFGGERPYTIYFSKRVNRAPGTGDSIPSYGDKVDSLDYEAELGVIIGKDAKDVKAENAEDYIFGYTIINDISARNLQTRHKQWYRGKSLDGFTPMGPCILTKDEVDNIQGLDISCRVNGELRQSSNTSCMIQTVAGAIAELSDGMTLQAGTIIATGTPAGVGMGMTPPTFLNPGDQISCSIEKIGTLDNVILK